ncbi:hypothetical protein SLNWT_1765 [Streptomyces albus]|uniref:AB hydrolase-1 domain-containing protein n=1 Tax=Streptomyces albus (strain ATCC 21838 / DSM 41398 / FERM P-419 / JCM 4703 / NBRC 107858) TaxID=1081613 RepID=A0A0B5ETT9_STRA4|nr:hypothetical protein SLNWT_1765 [Streptomyces albus]AOU76456.1 hypothetical protein SLNHY_1765 [Streptomyces albus]
MTRVHVTVWEPAGSAAGAPPAVFAHGIFTWGTDEAYGFGAQRPLAADRPLLLVDRRGYGDSPDTRRSDFETDAADLAEVLAELPAGAHLVGHANGGLAALLAAARHPGLVRSLALIQPAAFWPATEEPAVAALLERTADAVSVPEDTPAEDYLRASTEGLGMTMPEPTPRRLRAVRTSMRERPVWEAAGDLAPLAAAPWPKLVIAGDWEDAPPLYRKYAGEALRAAARAVAREIGGDHLTVPGYYPHTQQPERVNAALRALWERAEGRG